MSGSPTVAEVRTSTSAFSPRILLKSVVRALANLAVFPLLLSNYFGGFLLGRDRALQHSTEWLSLVPGLVGLYLRRAFLAWTLEFCHTSVHVGFGTTFSKTGARLNENVYIGAHCSLGLVHVMRDVLIAPCVHITSGSRMHGTSDLSRPISDQEGVFARVTIGSGVWIGTAAVVMADVGADSIIGAGAVVTKPVPEKVIAGGIPAKVIRDREELLKAEG